MLKVFLIALIIITAIIIIKYKPLYEISINGEIIGYVKSKSKIEELIKEKLLVSDNPSAINTTLNSDLVYKFSLVSTKETDSNEIISKLSSQTTTIYKVYAIMLNNEVKSYVNTADEAKQIVDEMKTEYSELANSVAVVEKYTEKIDDFSVVQLAEAETSVNSELREIKTEQEKIAAATCNGVYLSVKPVSGNITSRYGAVESVRDHVHAGIDIAAPAGTQIKATADGTVSYSGWMSGYGNLIIIDHANGVQTCYGHCSKLYAKVGDKVSAGDVIAAVGSTGNSTGNHLHFEIRVNGTKINPQKYIYKY